MPAMLSSLLSSLANLFIPKQKDAQALERFSLEDILACCALHHPHQLHGALALGFYEREPLGLAIRALKYGSSGHAAKMLALLLHGQSELIATCEYIVLIPRNPHHTHTKSKNHLTRIFEYLPAMQKRVLEDILSRCDNRPPQTRAASKEERMSLSPGDFQVHHKELFVGRKICLIDDVLTTGATLRAAKEALLKSGAKEVALIALADAHRSPK